MDKNQKRAQIQKEGSDAIVANKFRGILFISPRVGKTKSIIDALNTIIVEIKVLVLAPRKDILEGWKKECVTWGLLPHIKIDYLWSNSINKAPLGHYHLIIGDECHDFNNKVISKLRLHQIHGTRILGATGTLDEVTAFTWENILSTKAIYSYPFEQAIADGIIADYRITCIGLNLDDSDAYIAAGTADKPFFQTELQAYSYWNKKYTAEVNKGTNKNLKFLIKKRLDIIYNSRTKLNFTNDFLNKDVRCLIFTGRQSIADQIGDSYHSKSEKHNLSKFISGKINKLSTVNMISMGITIPNLKFVFFNQIQSGENLAIQQAMRAFNPEEGRVAEIVVIYLKDTQDEVWVKSALKGFDKSKINWK